MREQKQDMGVGQNILSILMGRTSIYQLFWGSLGASVLTNSHMTNRYGIDWDILDLNGYNMDTIQYGYTHFGKLT